GEGCLCRCSEGVCPRLLWFRPSAWRHKRKCHGSNLGLVVLTKCDRPTLSNAMRLLSPTICVSSINPMSSDRFLLSRCALVLLLFTSIQSMSGADAEALVLP